jgi:hypothetical protein
VQRPNFRIRSPWARYFVGDLYTFYKGMCPALLIEVVTGPDSSLAVNLRDDFLCTMESLLKVNKRCNVQVGDCRNVFVLHRSVPYKQISLYLSLDHVHPYIFDFRDVTEREAHQFTETGD